MNEISIWITQAIVLVYTSHHPLDPASCFFSGGPHRIPAKRRRRPAPQYVKTVKPLNRGDVLAVADSVSSMLQGRSDVRPPARLGRAC
jgi:hypothetical protein